MSFDEIIELQAEVEALTKYAKSLEIENDVLHERLGELQDKQEVIDVEYADGLNFKGTVQGFEEYMVVLKKVSELMS